MSDHPFWLSISKSAGDRQPGEKALAAAILLLSTRGDVYLKNEVGNDVVCSSMTMEQIFDALVVMHDHALMPAPR